MTVSEELVASFFSYSKPKMKATCSWCLSTKLNGVTYQTVNLIVTCRDAGAEVQGDALVPPRDSDALQFCVYNDSSNRIIIRQSIVILVNEIIVTVLSRFWN